MFVVITISLIALLFTYLESIGKFRDGMKWGFVLVTILGAIHYQYGSDYMAYYRLYQMIEDYPFNLKTIMEGDVFRDPGWVILCYLFKYLGGFFMMVAILNIVQNIIVYKFIKREVNIAWRPLAIFIYLFHTGFYLMSFTMMRQEFVIIIFLGIWPWIKEKKWAKCIIILYLCSFIHKTAFVLLPFSFWGYFPIKNKNIIYFYILSLLTLYISSDILSNMFNIFTDFEDFGRYVDTYGKDNKRTFNIGVGFVLYLLPVIASISYLINNRGKKETDKLRLVLLALIGNLIIPFSFISPIISRIGLYFAIYQTSSLPVAFNYIRNKTLRQMVLFSYSFIILYDYLFFFNSPLWSKSFSNFKTIFPVLFNNLI